METGEHNTESAASSSEEPTIKVIDDRYEVIRTLGSGGMGQVFLVEDRELGGEKLALKLLYQQISNDNRYVSRFRNEVLLARKLSHPNIVRIFDFGATSDEQYYITMEFVDGISLYDRLRDEEQDPLTFTEIVTILLEVATTLDHAHEHGVIHRDLKPDNVMLAKDGALKLTDFGIARSMDQEKGLTATGELVGTAYYMSPEQFRGSKVDARTDIYAFGIMAYELVTGERPFVHDNYVTLSAMHFTEPIPQMNKINKAVPRWFQDFVETCVEKDPKDRFQTMADVIEDLADYAPQGAIPLSMSMTMPHITSMMVEKAKKEKKSGFTKTIMRLFGKV